MINEVVIVAFISLLIMLLAYRLHHVRMFHVPVMIGIMLFDLCVPFYLYLNRDWKTRLIDHGDILSFMVWTHFGLLITLFVLYGIQILAGRRLLNRDESARDEHKTVAKGILLTRALVIMSGALLVQEEI